MIKKWIQKYREWKDERFLTQLERVLSNNVLESNIITSGSILIGNNAYICDKEELSNFNIEELRKKGYNI